MKTSRIERFKHEVLKNKAPIVFFCDNDCDGTLGASVLLNLAKNLNLECYVFTPTRNTHGYGFTQEALVDLFTKKCIFDPKSNQLVALKDIKDPVLFSADLGADLVKKECEPLQLELASRFKEIIITDHHESPSEIFTIDKLNYINLNTKHQLENNLEHALNLYSGAITGALVFSQIFDLKLCRNDEELLGVTILSDMIDTKHNNNLDLVLQLKNMQNVRLKNLVGNEFEMETLEQIKQVFGFNCINYINALSRLSGITKKDQLGNLILQYDNLSYEILEYFNPFLDEKAGPEDVCTIKEYNNVKKRLIKEIEQTSKLFACNQFIVCILNNDAVIKAGVSGLIASNLLKKYNQFKYALCVYETQNNGKIFFSGSGRCEGNLNLLDKLKASKYIESGGHAQAFGLGFYRNDVGKVFKFLKTVM